MTAHHTVGTTDAARAPTATSVMTTPVISVDAGMPLTSLWHLMQRLHLQAVVICDGRVPLGVVDRRDIWATWAADLAVGPATRAGAVVTPSPCVSPKTPLPAVCSALLSAHHETVMVLDDDGHLRGLITAADVLRSGASAGQQTAQTSEQEAAAWLAGELALSVGPADTVAPARRRAGA